VDPAKIAESRGPYTARHGEVRAAYKAVKEGRAVHPHATRERLILAVEGTETGERIPLTFPFAEEKHLFQKELAEALHRGGITDAVVQQVGSATTGCVKIMGVNSLSIWVHCWSTSRSHNSGGTYTHEIHRSAA
jgi:hypothetical protein